MRVAVIGTGSIGRRHIANLLTLGCDVVVEDHDPDRLSAAIAMGASAAVDGSSGLDYDAAVIATPWDRHLYRAHNCVLAGIPIFVEKPLGPLREFMNWQVLAGLAVTRGVTTQVGYQCRFHHVAGALRQLAPAESGFFATACDMRTWPGKSYGPLLLECSHDLDLALAMGAPTTVTDAVLDPHYVAIQLGPHWRVTIEDRADYRREWTVERRGQSMTATFNSPQALGEQMYRDELAHFLDCVRDGRQTRCPLSDGVRALEVAAQVEQMARRA